MKSSRPAAFFLGHTRDLPAGYCSESSGDQFATIVPNEANHRCEKRLCSWQQLAIRSVVRSCRPLARPVHAKHHVL